MAQQAQAQEGFDPRRARADFPALAELARGRPLVYLDNAATTQVPSAVIDALARFAREGRANVHRGVHALSERTTAAYEAARAKVARFVNAPRADEIVFVRGATDALNLVAFALGRARVGPGDEVVVTTLEHHSNLVPWQMLCAERGATLRALPITGEGELRLDDVEAAVGPRTRVVALAHAANALGTVNDVRAVAAVARARGALVVVDGAQAAAHLPVDVQALGCDFYALSGHKVYGPTGIGALWGRAELLEAMQPVWGGGEMVESVTLAGARWAPPPARFEAGTPNVEGAVGLGAALDYLASLDRAAVAAHERRLLAHATARVAAVPGARVVGPAPGRPKVAIVSFTLAGAHPHDVGSVLDARGVAVRAGHHCAQPLMERLGLPGTARASFALYNTLEEVDALADGIEAARKVLC